MPCNAAPSPAFSHEDMDALELYMQAQVDRVTQVACEAISILRKNGLFDGLTDPSKLWSREHDAWDAARELIESSIKAVPRKPHFDKNGNAFYQGPCDDKIGALRDALGYNGKVFEHILGQGPDEELAREVSEDFEAKKKVGSTVSKIKKAKK